MTFENQVRPLLQAHLGRTHKIVGEKIYAGGRGASVEVVCGDLLIRLTHERMSEFYVDVAASRSPTKWYELVYLVLLASGESPERAKVSVGHTMSDLEESVRRFAVFSAKISDLLSEENLSETERQMKDLKLSLMDPRLRAAISGPERKG